MMIRIIAEKSSTYKVKQKYPMVPTRDFITISQCSGKSSFTVYAGPNQRRIYSGTTLGDKIVSYYFDGMYAVFNCQKKVFVFGPSNPKKPEKGWRQIRMFSIPN